MITPSEELFEVLRALDVGDITNLEPAKKSLDAADRVNRYITRKVAAIRARRAGKIQHAETFEAECEWLYSKLPTAWRW